MKVIAVVFMALMVSAAGPMSVSDDPQSKPGEKPAASNDTTAGAPHRHGQTASSGCPMHGSQTGQKPGAMHGRGMRGRDEAHAADRDTIHALLADHTKISRKVEDIPNGVRTETTSSDAEVASLIQEHVVRMKDRMESGAPIRMHDPLFVELFKHHEKIRMTVDPIEGGARVVETSDDPQVVLLIRQHARKGIDEFIARGFDRAPEDTPLPQGYKVE